MNNKVNTILCMYDSATDPYIISYNNNKSYNNDTIYAPTRIIKKKDITIFWMVLQLHEVIHINVQQRLR